MTDLGLPDILFDNYFGICRWILSRKPCLVDPASFLFPKGNGVLPQGTAIQAFQIHRVGGTQVATGVIIFISSFERMVFVMGDADIRKHFKNEDFVEVKNAIIDGFRINQFGDGLVEGIRLCGQKLRQHYPLKPSDENELSNDLILWKQNL